MIYSKKEFVKWLIKRYPGQVKTLGHKFLNRWPVQEFTIIKYVDLKYIPDRDKWISEIKNKAGDEFDYNIIIHYGKDWRFVYFTFHSKEDAFEFVMRFM